MTKAVLTCGTAVAVLFTLNASTGAAPLHEKETFTNYGGGMDSCGVWLTERKGDNWYPDGQWVLGWLTAEGYEGAALRHTDSLAVAAWVDNYCQQHPLHQLITAAKRLTEELRKPE